MNRLAALALIASTALISAGDGTELDRARALHQAGVAGDRTAVTRCIAQLESLLAREASNQTARAWLGSALTLRARDLGLGPAKLATLKRGGRLMDEAVAASDDPEVRLIRALNSANLPAIFGRRAVAREDFRLLLERVRDPAHRVNEERAQAIYLHAGDFLVKDGRRAEGMGVWREGLRFRPGTVLAREISSRLTSTPGT